MRASVVNPYLSGHRKSMVVDNTRNSTAADITRKSEINTRNSVAVENAQKPEFNTELKKQVTFTETSFDLSEQESATS